MNGQSESHYPVAVIGAGASGVLVAVQWRARAAAGGRLALIAAGPSAARGLAYGTPYGAHLLNVPAARMSAFPDAPAHFLDWLRGRLPDCGPDSFAPRPLYGDYLASLLTAPPAGGPVVERVEAEAVGLEIADGRGWRVLLHGREAVTARNVVLALGNFPPGDPLPGTPAGLKNYIRDPWFSGAAAQTPPEGGVLFIGTGLTMVDLALALRENGHRGALVALSRHGRLPLGHAPAQPVTLAPPSTATRSAVALARWLHARLRDAAASGADWRSVIDGMRPHTARIWGDWPAAERARFLRHARNLWDVHRHRMAPEVAARVDALRAGGALRIIAGRIASLREQNDGLAVDYLPRHSDAPQTLSVSRVINCTGPASDFARMNQPLVAALRAGGWIRPDAFRLGVDTDATGRLISAAGAPVPGLFTLGPLRRGSLWESTAIPEIRVQAAELAALLASA